MHTLARTSDPMTSHAAAARVSEFARANHAKILAALRVRTQAGAEEIAQDTGLDAYAVRKRLPELEKVGAVAVVPGKTRKTATGRFERIWATV